jgi:hypothetical protein
MNNGLLGQIRVKFSMKSNDNATTVYGQVYKNSVAIGTEWTTTSSTYAVFTEDITVSFGPGDAIQLYLHSNGAATASAKWFRLYYDDSPTIAVSTTNVI